MKEVPVVAVSVPTFNVGNVVEPLEASMTNELPEPTVFAPV